MTRNTRIVLAALVAAGAAAALLLVPALRTGAQPGTGPFDLIANHYHCYQIIEWDNFQPTDHRLKDQFDLTVADVIRPALLCNPTQKDGTEIVDPDLHYVCYELLVDTDPVERKVLVTNQYGTATVKSFESELVCLPSKKTHP